MNTVLKNYVRAIFFIFPIIFIPVVIDGFGLGKNIALAVMAGLGLILWIIKLLIEKEKVIKTNKLFWLFLILVVWSGITFFRLGSGSRMVSLMNPMGFGTVVSFFVLFFLWLQVNNKEENEKQFLCLTISGVLAGIVSLIVFLIPTSKLPLSIPKNNPLVSITAGWSLIGSVWAEAVLFLFIILGWLKKLLNKVKEKTEFSAYIIEAAVVAFFSLLFLLDVYKIVKAGWTFLDFNSAWVIAVETFKKHPIFGMGIGNFLEAFTSYRPTSFNLTKYWSGSFSSSSMGILQIWTELGTVGLLLAFYLVAMVWKSRKKTAKFWKLALFLAVCLFLPLNLVVVFLLLWLLSEGVVENKESKLILNVGEKNFNVMPYVVSLFVLAGVGFSGYWTVRIFLGDFYMRKSLVTAAKNDGTKTYELQIKAIGFNPYSAGYRETYSQVNLSLAESLLANTDISDEDKEKASTLIQQAVREAKAAVTLSEKNPEYWYNLAGIYKSLVGVVSDSDVASWSYQAYQQAVVLDSINPVYPLDMGGLLYSAGSYESAERAFEQAATVKSDYANAWYNWAYAAKQQNKLSAAVSYLQQALTLVGTDSSDYETGSKELETWKAELEKATAEATAAAKAAQSQQSTTESTTQGGQTQQVPVMDSGSNQNTGTEEELSTPVDLPVPTSGIEETPTE